MWQPPILIHHLKGKSLLVFRKVTVVKAVVRMLTVSVLFTGQPACAANSIIGLLGFS